MEILRQIPMLLIVAGLAWVALRGLQFAFFRWNVFGANHKTKARVREWLYNHFQGSLNGHGYHYKTDSGYDGYYTLWNLGVIAFVIDKKHKDDKEEICFYW